MRGALEGDVTPLLSFAVTLMEYAVAVVATNEQLTVEVVVPVHPAGRPIHVNVR
jgi:hypothetical protein